MKPAELITTMVMNNKTVSNYKLHVKLKQTIIKTFSHNAPKNYANSEI